MFKLLEDSFHTRFNQLATHPLQSWEWGEFRKKTGARVFRFGKFNGEQLISGFQLTLHQLPFLPLYIGYIPKGPLPDAETIDFLTQFGKEHKCIFIKFEPNVLNDSRFKIYDLRLKLSPKPIFTKYSFLIDLIQTEDELLKNMSPKTRYNIRVAQKHDVTVQEENTDEAFNRYLTLTAETTKRQGFYAHDENYHRLMWYYLNQPFDPTQGKQPTTDNLQPIAHLITARYQGKILVTWILFLFHNTLYYPYGASSSEHKEVMASNLMMWEAMRWGKQQGAKTFDLWGTPGPDPKPTDPYFGFHRFKLGYGPKLVEFIGSYDLILNPFLYQLFQFANFLRWKLLKNRIT